MEAREGREDIEEPQKDIEKREDLISEKKEQVAAATCNITKEEERVKDVAISKFERFLGIALADREKHLLTATKDFNNIKNTINIMNGVFGIKLKQPVHITSGEFMRNITNEAISNFSCLNVSKELAFTRTNEFNFVGCNRKMINEDGTLNTAAVISDLTRNFPDKFFIPREVTEMTYRYSMEDSHVLYIYNMLTTWLYTLLYEASQTVSQSEKHGNVHMKIKLRRPRYEDSHCIIDYGIMSESNFVELEVCQAMIKTDRSSLYPQTLGRTKDNYFCFNHVLRIPSNISKEQYSFYIAHLYRRKPVSDYVNFDLGFYHTLSIVLIDQAGTYEGRQDSSIDHNLTSCSKIYPASRILQWIMEYVQTNNLFYDLALATEIIFRAAFWPVPETQEGNVWLQRGSMRIAVPEFQPIRGLYPNLFLGEAYMPPGIVNYYYSTKNQLMTQLLYGALENYAMIYALQVQIYVRTHFSHAWYAACRQFNETRQITNAWNLYEVLFKTVYKVDFMTNMNPCGYVTFIFDYNRFEGVVRVMPKTKKMRFINSKRQAQVGALVPEFGQPHMGNIAESDKILTFNDFRVFIKHKIYHEGITKYIKDVDAFKQVDITDSRKLNKYYEEYANKAAQDHDDSRFLITTLPAWVTGAMLDGSIDLPSVYAANIRPSWQFKAAGNKEWEDVILSKREALELTQAMRYFNKDLKFVDRLIPDVLPAEIRPWANVHQRIIEPSSLLYVTKSKTIYYYGEAVHGFRANLRFDREPWTFIEMGYTINKSKGSYYACEFMSTRVVTGSRIIPLSYDDNEVQLMANFQSAHGQNLVKFGFEHKMIEEDKAKQHFHRPGAVVMDPASMLPGQTLLEGAGSQEKKKA